MSLKGGGSTSEGLTSGSEELNTLALELVCVELPVALKIMIPGLLQELKQMTREYRYFLFFSFLTRRACKIVI